MGTTKDRLQVIIGGAGVGMRKASVYRPTLLSEVPAIAGVADDRVAMNRTRSLNTSSPRL
ncbi:hypothetical protein SUNI508_08348 [Seiridium unicorne]|uniref:Uncharacterized protein n=1 Tax=Seiridium unicorne TaxID=138068 RepID=A0ABR2UUW6_9PEZI